MWPFKKANKKETKYYPIRNLKHFCRDGFLWFSCESRCFFNGKFYYVEYRADESLRHAEVRLNLAIADDESNKDLLPWKFRNGPNPEEKLKHLECK